MWFKTSREAAAGAGFDKNRSTDLYYTHNGVTLDVPLTIAPPREHLKASERTYNKVG